MAPGRRKKIVIAVGAVVLCIMAVLFVIILHGINSYKSRIETALSEKTGFDVKINGNMGFSLFPFSLSAKDIHVTKNGKEILSLDKIKSGIEFSPLLNKKFILSACKITKPTVFLEKNLDGKYNFENTEKKSAEKKMGGKFSLKKLELSQGNLVYSDKKKKDKTELKNIDLTIEDLSLDTLEEGILRNISFKGRMECKELVNGDLKIHNLTSAVEGEQGVFRFDPLAMDIFGGKGEGTASISASGADNLYEINVKVSNLDFVNFEQSLRFKKVIGGRGALDIALKMGDGKSRNFMSSLNGTFSLAGDNLTIYTMDLDKVLSAYESSQKFRLIDIGAFFIAGPLGTAGLKGYGYFDVYGKTQGGQGEIKEFIALWAIKDGVARALDCALSTPNNRVALKGNLNLVGKRYENVTVALLNDRGCAKVKQSVNGPFASPKIGAVSTAETIAGPILNLFKKAKNLVKKDKCEIFYNGSVKQP